MLSIIFDVDDTLYNQIVPFRDACKEVLGVEQLDQEERLYQAFSQRSHEIFDAGERGEISLEESRIYRITKGMEDCGIKFTQHMAMEFQEKYAENQKKLTVSPTIETMLDACKKAGMNMGIITNGPYQHQMKKIETLGLPNWIPREHVVISGEVGYAKPDLHIFQAATTRMHLDPASTYMVGDVFEKDIVGGIQAGWKTIWMNHRNHPMLETQVIPDYTVYTEEELKIFLLKLIKDCG